MTETGSEMNTARDADGSPVCPRIAIHPRTVAFTEQVGLGILRCDTIPPRPNATAESWLDGHMDAFTASEVVRTALRTTDPGAQWDYVLPSGRALRIKRVADGGRLWLILSDVTLETDHASVMEDVADVGAGFVYYIPATRRHRVYGSFLDQKLSPSEQLEIRQRGLIALVHTREQPRMAELIRELYRTGEPFRTAVACRTRRGEVFTLDVHVRAIRAADGTICKIIGVFRDITDERRTQGELLRLRNEADSDREAQNHLLARVGHEIRTPMSGVIGMADALMNMEGTENFRAQLSIIQNATRDALSMLDETMDFSKLGTDQFRIAPQEVDVAEVVRETVQLWRGRAAQAATQVRLRRDPDLPGSLLLDPRRLRQILTNLLSNAVKFAPGGDVEVILASMSDRGGTDGDTADGGETPRLILAVRDNGGGMSAAEQARLWTPYAQGSAGSAAGGSGLGLSITREIVSRMGGAIRCTSTPAPNEGHGTTFVVTLPMETPDAGERDLVGNLLAKGTRDTDELDVRVLAVDDNRTNLLVVENLLAGRVASVDFATDGVDALDMMTRGTYDVVLMDIHMPRMDGIEATLAIRNSGQSWADVPIVALTADATFQQKRVVMNIGMDDVLPKPLTLRTLLDVFERLNLGQPEPDLRNVA